MSCQPSAVSRQLPAEPEAWVGGYVGIPWVLHGRARTGCDCWGLVRLVLLERAGVLLPAYGEGYAGADLAHLDEVAGVIAGNLSEWAAVPLSGAQALDLLLLRIWGRPMHIAILVARNWMLHSQEGCDSVLENCDARHWIRRIEGVYRHASLV